ELDREAPARAAAAPLLAVRARHVSRERVERAAAQLAGQLERHPVARLDRLVYANARGGGGPPDPPAHPRGAPEPQPQPAPERQAGVRPALAAIVEEHPDQQAERLLVHRAVYQVVHTQLAKLVAQGTEVLPVHAQPDRRSRAVAGTRGAQLDGAPHRGDQELARRGDLRRPRPPPPD